MNFLISLLFMPLVFAKPAVLLSYFDAFRGSSFNNSEKMAKALEQNFAQSGKPITVKLCPLNTIFDKAYGQLEDCLKKMKERPVLVLGLGESACELKVETMVRNKDKTITGPDNAGVLRDGKKIISEAPEVLGLRYPLPQMYCALSTVERSSLNLSHHAGSFVCNNTAFQMSYYYPEIQFGFIHVPNNKCDSLAKLTEDGIHKIMKMIPAAVAYLESAGRNDLPHPSNEKRLPTSKKEIKALRATYKNDSCMSEYFNRSKHFEKGLPFTGLTN